MILGLHHLELAFREGEEEAGRRFWNGVLGLPEIPKPLTLDAGGCWFRLPDGRELHLGCAGEFAPATKAHPAFAVADIDTVAAALTAAGHPVKWDTRLERRRFYSADPWGNRLEFTESSPSR